MATSSNRESRRVIRLKLKDPLKVMLCSIGSDKKYHVWTKDISTNGIFLDYPKPQTFPFKKTSIIEVHIQVSEEKKIFLNGKLARVVLPGDPAEQISGTGIALRIVQIDAANEKELAEFIALNNKNSKFSNEEDTEEESDPR